MQITSTFHYLHFFYQIDRKHVNWIRNKRKIFSTISFKYSTKFPNVIEFNFVHQNEILLDFFVFGDFFNRFKQGWRLARIFLKNEIF